MKRVLPLICLAIAFALPPVVLCQTATDAAPKFKKVLPAMPAGVSSVTREVAVYPEHTVTVLVYMPDQPAKYPAILQIHGGGWRERQVDSDRPLAERLASQGFVVALVSYRLSGEAPYPAALSDCKSAVRFLRDHAEEFKIDPTRIGCMGGSAGGHLSGLLAMTSGLPALEGDGPCREQSSTVQACVVMAATMDLSTYAEKTPEPVSKFFGGDAATLPEIFLEASPITHVRTGVPPTIFIEGEKDTAKAGRPEMMARLREVGVETEIFTLKDAPHPFWMSQPWLEQTAEIATKFFKKHLGEPGS